MDNKIIDRVIAGDEEACKQIYDLYKYKVYKLCLSIVRNQEAADDIMQEVFITVFTKAHKLLYNDAFSSWLYKITINSCNNYFRKNKEYTVECNELNEEMLDDKENNNPDNILQKKETSSILKKYIYELPQQLRNCIILFYFNDMSLKEIALIEDCSEGAVKSRLFKAKKKLKKKLGLKETDKEVEIYEF